MSSNNMPFSVRLDDEHKDMVNILKEKLGLHSWSAVIIYSLDFLWKNTEGIAASSNKAIIINSKIAETMTGDLLGSFQKKKKKIAAIEKALEDGEISEQRAKQFIADAEYNYKRSMEAMLRDYDEINESKAEEQKKSGLASIISKRIQQENDGKSNMMNLKEKMKSGECKDRECPPGAEESCEHCSGYTNKKFEELGKNFGELH